MKKFVLIFGFIWVIASIFLYFNAGSIFPPNIKVIEIDKSYIGKWGLTQMQFYVESSDGEVFISNSLEVQRQIGTGDDLGKWEVQLGFAYPYKDILIAKKL